VDGLVLDVMHDVLEECLPCEVKEMLKVFINVQLFTLEKLNDIILSFLYGLTDAKNQPSIISTSALLASDHSLKQSG
jgi:hypothetical protein